jgi:hypothetical protein
VRLPSVFQGRFEQHGAGKIFQEHTHDAGVEVRARCAGEDAFDLWARVPPENAVNKRTDVSGRDDPAMGGSGSAQPAVAAAVPALVMLVDRVSVRQQACGKGLATVMGRI